MEEYIQGKINVAQLFAIAAHQNRQVATKKQIEDAIKNKYTFSYLCDLHNVTEKVLAKKLNKILDKLREK